MIKSADPGAICFQTVVVAQQKETLICPVRKLAFRQAKNSASLNSSWLVTYPKNRHLSRNVFTNYVPSDLIQNFKDTNKNLESLILSGELFEKFLDKRIRFPEVPKTFESFKEYQAIWQFLIQYEIFNKLLQSS